MPETVDRQSNARTVVSHINQDFHSPAYKKFQDFSTTSQDPQNIFPGLCHSRATLTYRKIAVTYSHTV